MTKAEMMKMTVEVNIKTVENEIAQIAENIRFNVENDPVANAQFIASDAADLVRLKAKLSDLKTTLCMIQNIIND